MTTKNVAFYCATIAYHVGLNALLVAARHHNQRLRKKTFILGRSLRLSSRDLPLLLQLFSLVATILQSLVSIYCRFLSISQCSVIVIRPFLCRLTCQSADIMSSLCGVGVRVNNFFSKTTRPRDMLFFLKDTLSIEDEKLFKACKSICSSVC